MAKGNLKRAEEILEGISMSFHRMEEDGLEIPYYVEVLWVKLTDYFQGIYEDIPEIEER